MTEKQQPNPLREGLSTKAVPQPCAIVIFGATGDLTHRKLVPALYNIAADGELPPAVAVVGFARRPKTDDEFRKEMEEATRKFSRQTVRDEIWDGFAKSLFYHQSEFGDEAGYEKLARASRPARPGERHARQSPFLLRGLAGPVRNHFAKSEKSRTEQDSRRELGPRSFWKNHSAPILNLRGTSIAWCRVPFRKDQTYRIDHFLGKETAQNILVLRFANAIFEPLWNARYIDHVQITAAETLGVENRAGYYEGAGALRDMVQNHLLQLLCLVGMEPPTDLGADSIRDEKVKVVRSIRRFKEEEVATQVVRGQYSAGVIAGKSVAAYREEKGVDPQVANRDLCRIAVTRG